MSRKKIGQIYIEMGLLTEEQVTEVLKITKETGMKFLEAVLASQYLTKEILEEYFGTGWNVDFEGITPREYPLATKYLISPKVIMKYGVLPLGSERLKGEDVIKVGMIKPNDMATLESLSKSLQSSIMPKLVLIEDFLLITEKVYKTKLAHFSNDPQLLHPLLQKELGNQIKKIKSTGKKYGLKGSVSKGNFQTRKMGWKGGVAINEISLRSDSKPIEAKIPKEAKADIKLDENISKTQDAPSLEEISISFVESEKKNVKNEADSISIEIPVAEPESFKHNEPKTKTKKKPNIEIQKRDRERRVETRFQPKTEICLSLKCTFPTEEGGNIRPGEFRKFFVSDINSNGVAMYGNSISGIKPGFVHDLMFSLPNHKGEMIYLSTQGRVSWKKESKIPGQNKLGIELQHPKTEVQDAWEKLLLKTTDKKVA